MFFAVQQLILTLLKSKKLAEIGVSSCDNNNNNNNNPLSFPPEKKGRNNNRSTPTDMAQASGLRPTKRYITTHDVHGQSVFDSKTPEEPHHESTAVPVKLALCYATQNFPVDIQNGRDITKYEELMSRPSPGITIPNGSSARVVDFPPDHTSAMHRTISVNYNFVIEGELELILDSGETRQLKPGDMLVQRAINHAWRNPSSTNWARIAAVSFPATGIKQGEAGTAGTFK